MQPLSNGTLDIDAALTDVARIYRSLTGRDLPLGNTPLAPIPPEQDPAQVARGAVERLALLLQRVGHPAADGGKVAPPVDCWESAHELLVVADLPGVERNTLQLRIEKGSLIVTGRREPVRVEGARAAALERPVGTVERRILLPAGITAEPLGAEYANGVLRVRLSRKEGTMASRSIQVG